MKPSARAASNGSQMLPTKAVCTMKSVGLHVASDALALGNLAGPHPDGGRWSSSATTLGVTARKSRPIHAFCANT